MIKDNNSLMAQRVKVVPIYKDISGHNHVVHGDSLTIESLTGASITDAMGSILIANLGNAMLYLEPSGTAGPDSWPIPPGGYYEIGGNGDYLRSVQLYSSSTLTGIMYREVYQ